MTDKQWEDLLRIIDGDQLDPLPVGFLVDGPWITGISSVGLMDYFIDSQVWLEANLEAVRRFPNVLWLPGFWAEFGMISNPPAFGTRCVWPEDGFPTCEPVLRGYGDIGALKVPNVRTDGLLPFITRRLEQNQTTIEEAGHRIRFATSHGPLTIASYLLGHTELLIGMRTDPEAVQQLLETVTVFIMDWLTLQKEKFPSIDGVLVLEDLMGFIGDRDFQAFALPYGKRIFNTLDVSVRFLHNDAHGLVTARYLTSMGVNLFNFSFEHDFSQIRELAGKDVTLMGNIPPRDVLATGSEDDIRTSVAALLDTVGQKERMIISAGGFTPAQFTAPKIETFCRAARGGPKMA
jgi:uroporphyrinogen decarboxylase